jgi:hypothetical protein
MRSLALHAPAFALAILLSGCWVQSLQPFHTPETTAKVPELAGPWKFVSQFGDDLTRKEIRPWTFGEKLTAYDRNNVEGTLVYSLFKVGDHVYLDAIAGEPREESTNAFWHCLVRPVHSLVRVEVKGDELVLLPLSYDWLKEKVEAREVSLPVLKSEEVDEKEQPKLLFNASPEQWEQFLKKHGGDEEAFTRKNALVFKRAAAAPAPPPGAPPPPPLAPPRDF